MIGGGCYCGAVRWTAHAEPKLARVCWCRTCQYLGAGTGTASAFFKTADLRFEGTLTYYESTADSGNAMRRGFCPQCGTPITTGALKTPELVGVRLGSFDDPGHIAPSSTIWVESAPGWACIDTDLPAEPKQPPPLG